MGFSTSTCTEFVEVLASKAPVPGGGGASALVGAVGTALGNMVGSLTVGKKKYADVEEEMWELKGKCDQLQKDFLRLIERDAEVFEPLSKAYGFRRYADRPEYVPETGAVSDGCHCRYGGKRADQRYTAAHRCVTGFPRSLWTGSSVCAPDRSFTGAGADDRSCGKKRAWQYGTF